MKQIETNIGTFTLVEINVQQTLLSFFADFWAELQPDPWRFNNDLAVDREEAKHIVKSKNLRCNKCTSTNDSMKKSDNVA